MEMIPNQHLSARGYGFYNNIDYPTNYKVGEDELNAPMSWGRGAAASSLQHSLSSNNSASLPYRDQPIQAAFASRNADVARYELQQRQGIQSSSASYPMAKELDPLLSYINDRNAQQQSSGYNNAYGGMENQIAALVQSPLLGGLGTPQPLVMTPFGALQTPMVNTVVYDDAYWRNNPVKPPFSYRTLVAKALHAAGPKGKTLREIYDWIELNFAYFGKATSGNGASWRSSVRHNLVSHKEFMRVPQADSQGNDDTSTMTPAKSRRPRWTLTPEYYERLCGLTGSNPASHNSSSAASSPTQTIQATKRSRSQSDPTMSPKRSCTMPTFSKAGVDIRRSASAPTVSTMELAPSFARQQLGTLTEDDPYEQLRSPYSLPTQAASSTAAVQYRHHGVTCAQNSTMPSDQWAVARSPNPSSMLQHRQSAPISTPVLGQSRYPSNLGGFNNINVRVSALGSAPEQYLSAPMHGDEMQSLALWLMDS